MENKKYIFEISPYDISLLLPQVSKALEKRIETISRERYPGMWQHTDHMKQTAQGKNRSPLRTKLSSLLCLAVGIFLLVPGLVKPQELLVPLLAGAIAVIMGIFGLWNSRKNRPNPFDKSAKLLLAGKENLPEGQVVSVTFSDQGMTIPTDNDDTELVPYDKFECAIETADALLFVYGDHVTVLQKQDLKTGNLVDLSNLLSEKAPIYHSI